MWEFSNEEKDGEILISFLKRSPVKGYIPQINSIFRSGGIPYSLVNFQVSMKQMGSLINCSICPKDLKDNKLNETARETKINYVY